MPPCHEALRGHPGPTEIWPGLQALCSSHWSPLFALLLDPFWKHLGVSLDSLIKQLIPPSTSSTLSQGPHVLSLLQSPLSVPVPLGLVSHLLVVGLYQGIVKSLLLLLACVLHYISLKVLPRGLVFSRK